LDKLELDEREQGSADLARRVEIEQCVREIWSQVYVMRQAEFLPISPRESLNDSLMAFLIGTLGCSHGGVLVRVLSGRAERLIDKYARKGFPGTLNFSAEKSRRLVAMGYEDTLRQIREAAIRWSGNWASSSRDMGH
jgi:hypothetical protein